MDRRSELGHWRELSIGYDDALLRLPEVLKTEGFGIVTQIDLQETFRAKLGADFRRYRILGACHPAFAHRALQEDLRLGVLLPCNVVLYEDDVGKVWVGAIDPAATLGALGRGGALEDLAEEVGARLERALARLSS